MSDSAPLARDSIVAQLGLRTTVDGGTARGQAEVVEELCIPGTGLLRTSVLATWADVLTGAVAGIAIDPKIPLTADLEVHLRRPLPIGTAVVVDARPVKLGRTVLLVEADVRDATTDEPVAVAVVSFIASPNPEHVWADGFPQLGHLGGRLSVPLAERIGSRIVAPGTAEVPHRPDGLNASGAIQGGLVAFGAEEAAGSTRAEPSVVQSLVLRYLRPFSVGPAVAVAEPLGDDLVVVRMTDAGTGKPGALATVRLAAAVTR